MTAKFYGSCMHAYVRVSAYIWTVTCERLFSILNWNTHMGSIIFIYSFISLILFIYSFSFDYMNVVMTGLNPPSSL